VLGLSSHVAGQDRFFRRVFMRPLDAQNVFKFNLGSHEVIQRSRGLVDASIARFSKRAETRDKVHMDGLSPEQRICRYAVATAESLQLVNARVALSFLDGYERRARDASSLRAGVLSNVRSLPSNLQSFAQLQWT
jgi:hypothetical protein